MKYKIEKNTVQETLILPLYSRKLCTELYPNLYRDETSVWLLDQIDLRTAMRWFHHSLSASLAVCLFTMLSILQQASCLWLPAKRLPTL